MASNMNNSQLHKVSERRNEEGLQETIVETVDYRSYAGQDPQKQLRREDVEVIHQHHPDQGGSGSGAGVLGGAASVIANTIKSAKDAISGGGTTNDALPISRRHPK
ncbi:uncharacterized protein LOC122068809 [Macadamia integrifolia]|uniref:uncharacterized protein LOC122068809 n=1 Tax=Macadamia integrifolia TaxID=60698 RepID=UPI001C500BF5|nr:uncharacterized protein LOC122068809 [Macadamia integrifolia]